MIVWVQLVECSLDLQILHQPQPPHVLVENDSDPLFYSIPSRFFPSCASAAGPVQVQQVFFLLEEHEAVYRHCCCFQLISQRLKCLSSLFLSLIPILTLNTLLIFRIPPLSTTTMSILSPSPTLPSAVHRRRLITTNFTKPTPSNSRRRLQSSRLLPKPSAKSFVITLCDPVSLVLDGIVSLLPVFGLLPPDFTDRWKLLTDLQEKEAEAWLARLPFHLIHAVTASEDQRFFYHYGIDLHGIARAVVNYPKGGGGSTITQQLVKRVFLSSERKLSRKFIEGLLSLLVEKRISKWIILYSYLKKMYWGRGVYGIESASQFYFGKSPSSLSVGESAMLAGILPGPEFLNPLTNPKRAKSSQAKVLRRMVSAGYLEMETALQIAREPFYLYPEDKTCAKGADQVLTTLYPSIII